MTPMLHKNSQTTKSLSRQWVDARKIPRAVSGSSHPAHRGLHVPQQSTSLNESEQTSAENEGQFRPSRRKLINMSLSTISTFAFATCACCSNVAGEAKASEWTYSPDTSGPYSWPGVCTVGQQQSPVNLLLSDTVHLNSPKYKDLVFQYDAPVDANLINTGHGSMQVNFGKGKTCVINDQTYDLLQYHFHTPSEHAMDGQRFDMEVHLVHKSQTTGNLAVVGVMLTTDLPLGNDKARENPCLANCLKMSTNLVPGVVAPVPQPKLTVDPLKLLPKSRVTKKKTSAYRPYLHYPGSLTTPPCSESVDWFVMVDPMSVSEAQVLSFMKFAGSRKTLGQNSRPIQPFLGRAFDYNL
ncbi:hypothetical protein CEUSTIGMA_g1303.t1 [Chlamydomonas eustigma]|uniref:Carbonic anhydrase n=1 Tax=Chlamydomonas eustigma TaxID=1157962 RepID=A0A250WSQ4_9CHLO|nr:hypothetical protein CEUSTIGMA_g1303.t1 [Chlamydomonas eustigma]|eukprot:GAX73853.1 hypothetical protein CEUSTIGMA_g1303.t1 [Chlamydomonas eustigma]